MMHPNVTLSTCCLNQWALDFDGNLQRIKRSIQTARDEGSSYRIGPELETTAYGCEDHFLEPDTLLHSWQVIASILADERLSQNFLIDIGAPVLHRSVLYNCRVLILNREILLIRPKCVLADDGNYRESRWFRAWSFNTPVRRFTIPPIARNASLSGARDCAFGACVLLEDTNGISLSFELCEELWSSRPCHVDLYLAGADIIANGSASHHQLRKLHHRIDLVRSATTRAGGIYLYANQRGCDGGRLYYDGAPLAALNGSLLARGRQFALDSDVEVLTISSNINSVRSFRAQSASRGVQATQLTTSQIPFHRIYLPDSFSFASRHGAPLVTSNASDFRTLSASEEIAYGPACWLWDYLRRSRQGGFFLPLSGGADSCATAVIVGCMCQLLVRAATQPNCDEQLLREIRFAAGEDSDYVPNNARELAGKLLCTMYMGSSRASSQATRERARNVAEQIGAWHHAVEIDGIVEAFLQVVRYVFGAKKEPKFRADGGSNTENLALQNVQARIRMVLSYLFAQLANWVRGRNGSLLVLGSANVDESLRGYLTKYDCSAADINPIGGISKRDLREFLRWAASSHGLGYTTVDQVVLAKPTAELEPIVNGQAVQTDELDMGMTYDELSVYGRLRKIGLCGPVSMFHELCTRWREKLSVEEIANKVKFFWRMYAINRHKLTTLPPSYHAENYSPEDNRFDLRQFLYRTSWPWQFAQIDEIVKRNSEKEKTSDK